MKAKKIRWYHIFVILFNVPMSIMITEAVLDVFDESIVSVDSATKLIFPLVMMYIGIYAISIVAASERITHRRKHDKLTSIILAAYVLFMVYLPITIALLYIESQIDAIDNTDINTYKYTTAIAITTISLLVYPFIKKQWQRVFLPHLSV